MSNELRGLLEHAAGVPGAEPDVDGALRRGRALRVRRRITGALVAVAVVAAGAATAAALDNHGGGHSSPEPVASTPAFACPRVSRAPGDVPAWAAPARPPKSLPHVLAREGNVIAFLFGYPLRAGHPSNRTNKILWVVREPRHGQPLVVTGALDGAHPATMHASFPADSSPGEIYPSIVNVPAAGCWHFALRWNGHHATINLAYASAAPLAGHRSLPVATTAEFPTLPAIVTRVRSVTRTRGDGGPVSATIVKTKRGRWSPGSGVGSGDAWYGVQLTGDRAGAFRS